MKKRFILISGLALFTTASFAQVGVDTNDPKATLDVRSSPANTSRVDGIIAPRLTGAQLRAKNALYGTDQNSTLVYVTAADTSPAGKTVNVTSIGYYYYDAPNSVWVKVSTGVAAAYQEPWNVAGGTTPATTNNQSIYQNGNIGIRTINPLRALHITGTGDGSDDIYIETNSTTASSSGQMQFNRRRGVDVPAQLNDRIGDVTFGALGAADGTSKFNGSIGAIVSKAPTKDNVPIDLLFRAGATSEEERMRITYEGNVGIGTDAPKNKLEIKQGTNGNSGLRFTNLTGASFLGTNASGDVVKTTLPTNTGILSTNANGDIVAATAANVTSLINSSVNNIYNANGSLSSARTVAMGTNTLTFSSTATTGTSHFSVDGNTFNVDAVNDRVGIGYGAPAHKLAVNGDAFINTSLTIAGSKNPDVADRYLLKLRTGADAVSYGNISDDRGILFYKEGAHSGTVAAISAGLATTVNGSDNRYMAFKVRNDTHTDNWALTIRSFGAGAKDYNVGIGNFDPKNKLEVTHGTDGNSGLRLTNLKSAQILGTNANGDVVKTTLAEGGSNWTSPVVIDGSGNLRYHKIYDWSATASIGGVANSHFMLNGYILPDDWGAVYEVSIARVDGCGLVGYLKAKVVGSTHNSTWKIYHVESYYAGTNSNNYTVNTGDINFSGNNHKVVRVTVSATGCQDGGNSDSFNMGIAINPTNGNLGFVNSMGVAAAKTYSVRITQIL